MAEDLYAKPDPTKKVRVQRGEKEDIDNVTIYDNCWAEGSTPPKSRDNTTEDQQQTTSVSVSAGQRNLLRPAVVFLGLLCLLLLAAVFVLVVQLTQDKRSWNAERDRLWTDYTNLTCERDKLQRRYSELERLSHYLTQKTSQLENEKALCKAINKNLTKERDELQTQIESTCCPDNWIKFGNSCYLIPPSKKNWHDSRMVCESHDAQLVTISSIEEQEFITSLRCAAWIGLTDLETEYVWKWVNGTEVKTTYWRAGQPDNFRRNENCVQVSVRYPNLYNWNDLRCSYLLRFICEKILQ